MDPAALEDALERYAGRVAGVLTCATFGTAPAAEQRQAWRELCDAHDVPLADRLCAGVRHPRRRRRPARRARRHRGLLLPCHQAVRGGEGGVVTTSDPELAARIGRLINFGLEPGTRISADIGMNGKMSELHAAASLAMLDRIEDVVALRQANAVRLRAAIGPDANLQYQAGTERSTWQIFHVLCPTPEMRDRAVALAPSFGVEVRTMHDPALHTHPAFADCRRQALPVTEAAAARALALPMANALDDAAIGRIAELVHAAR